jgi:hypothetical protein
MNRPRQRPEKSWLCWLFKERSFTGSKSPKPSNQPATVVSPSKWDPSTPSSMALKKKGWLNLVGAMKNAANEAELAAAITDLQDWVQQFSATSKHSAQISLHGNQLELEFRLPVTDLDDLSRIEMELGIRFEPIERIHQSPRAYETWADRWVAYPVSCLFSEDQREEWIGDLYEVRDGLIDRCYPLWLVNLIITGRTLILVVSALKITIMDLLAKGFRQSS